MRISDWSSDVCSSDRPEAVEVAVVEVEQRIERRIAPSHRSDDPIVAWEVAAAFDRAIGGEAHLVSQLRDDIVDEIGRAHVCTPIPNAHLVCRLMLDTTTITHNHYPTQHHHL